MKKLVLLLAAVSLCTGSLVGCDDNKDSSKAELGENCTKDKHCESNYCDMTDEAETGHGVCANKPDQEIALLGNGKECTEDSKCESGWCKADAEDAEKKICTAKLGENEDCAGFEDYCAENLTCKASGESKSCAAATSQKAQIGDECADHSDCENSFCKKNSGEEKGVCTAKLADEAECTAAIECVNGFCNKASESDETGHCASSAVVPPKGFGETCTADSECESENCVGEEGSKTCGNVNPCKDFVPHCDNTGAKPIAYMSCTPDAADETQPSFVAEECDNLFPRCVEESDAAYCEISDEPGSCAYDSHCLGDMKNAKCGPDHKCIEPTPKPDACVDDEGNDIACEEGSDCISGICVTSAMKNMHSLAAQEGGFECDPEDFQEFCYFDSAVTCGSDGKVRVDGPCGEIGQGHCTIVNYKPAEGAKGADAKGIARATCSGHEINVRRCEVLESRHLQMCAVYDRAPVTQFVRNFTCIFDNTWHMVAASLDLDEDTHCVQDDGTETYCNYYEDEAGNASTVRAVCEEFDMQEDECDDPEDYAWCPASEEEEYQ